MIAAQEIPLLLRGEPESLVQWLRSGRNGRGALCIAVIVVGAGVYGAVVGSWRSPWQAVYTGIKLPLILLATATGNGLINGMLAPLMGVPLTMRQSFMAVLMSFAVAAAILGGMSPVVAFLIWNLPAMAAGGTAPMAYTFLLLSQVAVIAWAGIAGNVRLLRLLESWSGRQAPARILLVGWLFVNMMLGTQLTWILRPFFGSPHLPVAFFRPNALEGNFFESVYYSMRHLLSI